MKECILNYFDAYNFKKIFFQYIQGDKTNLGKCGVQMEDTGIHCTVLSTFLYRLIFSK